ncbi:hypothetical protein ACHQM5_007806 [Ranunculus cassubicifolius]
MTSEHSASCFAKNGIFHHPHGINLRHFQASSDTQTCDNSSFLQASCLQHWFKNWQEERKKKLTASTFAAAIGFWPGRREQLWLEKIGAIKPFSGNMATTWGNIKEEVALERYKLITEQEDILFPEFQSYDSQDDWLGCSPDGVVDRVVYGLPSRGVLEIKCPYFGGEKYKMYPWSRLPLYCIPQAQGLMEILDRDWMDLYCWTINGSSLFRIYRDPEYWELMRIALSEFWWQNVIPAREYYKIYPITKPHIEMRSLRPSPRHELCPAIVLASKYVVDNSELKMRELHGKLHLQRSWDFPQLKYDQLQTEEFEKELRKRELRSAEEMWG